MVTFGMRAPFRTRATFGILMVFLWRAKLLISLFWSLRGDGSSGQDSVSLLTDIDFFCCTR